MSNILSKCSLNCSCFKQGKSSEKLRIFDSKKELVFKIFQTSCASENISLTNSKNVLNLRIRIPSKKTIESTSKANTKGFMSISFYIPLKQPLFAF